jgi:hypothetical protein
MEEPFSVTFVPVDFEQQSLIDSLRTSGYRTDVPGLFSWPGVTVYLTPECHIQHIAHDRWSRAGDRDHLSLYGPQRIGAVLISPRVS